MRWYVVKDSRTGWSVMQMADKRNAELFARIRNRKSDRPYVAVHAKNPDHAIERAKEALSEGV